MGGIFDSGTSTTTSNTGTAPWSAAQPSLKKGLSEANKLYDAGSGHNAYDQSLVVGRDPTTQAAMDQMGQYAQQQGANLQQPMNFAQGMLSSGGLTDPMQRAMQGMEGMAGSGGFNQYSQNATQGMQDLYNRLSGSGGLSDYQQQAGQGMLGMINQGGLSDAAKTTMQQQAGVAAGNELQGQNPAFQDILDKSTENVTTAVNQNAMGQGRYGSGAHQGVLGDTVGDMTARMYSDEYTRQLGRQDQARQNQFNMGQAGMGNQMSGYNNLAGLGQSGIGNQQNAAQGLFGAGNTGFGNQRSAYGDMFNAGQSGMGNMFQGAGMIPGAYQTGQAGMQDLLKLGGMNEELQGRELADQERRFREKDMSDWNRLNQFIANTTGAGQLGSSSTSNVLTPTPSPFNQAVGIGSNLLGMGMMGGMFNGMF